MELPHIEIVEREFASQAAQAVGEYVVIQVQSEWGPVGPSLVSNGTQLLNRYTLNGYIPQTATNRSALYAALEILKETDKCWVSRVVPNNPTYPARYAAAHILSQEGLSVVVASSAVNVTGSKIEVTPASFPFNNGDAVVLRGKQLPLGWQNGVKYFMRVEESGGTYTLRFFDTYDHAIAATNVFTGQYAITSVGAGSYTFEILLASDFVRDGISINELATYSPATVDAFVVYAACPGKGGANVHVTVDVPRYPEEDLSCAEVVRLNTNEFAATQGWLGTTTYANGTPIYIAPVGSGVVLPTDSGDASLVAGTKYFISGGEDSLHFKVADTAPHGADGTEIDIKTAGSGKVKFVPAAMVVDIATDAVNFETRTITDSTIPDGARVIPVGASLPSPLRQGTEYEVTRYVDDSGTPDATKFRLRYTGADSGTVALASSTFEAFKLFVLGTAETVVYAKAANDDLLTLAQTFPDAYPVKLSLTGVVSDVDGDPVAALPAGTDANTVYYLGVGAGGKYGLYTSAANAASKTDAVALGTDLAADLRFKVVPYLATAQEVDLSGAIDYVNNTVCLKTHVELAGDYQMWAAGEAVRVFPTGNGSVLPSVLKTTVTYYLVPVSESEAKIMRLAGQTLSGVTSLEEVDLSASVRGTGTLTLAPAAAPLDAGTFRIGVWKTNYNRYGTVPSGVVSVSKVEEFICSLQPELKDAAGRNLYIADRLLASNYIRAKVNTAAIEEPGTQPAIQAAPFLVTLGGGNDGGDADGTGTISSADLINGLSLFTNPTDKPVAYFCDGGLTFAEYQLELIRLAERRGDSVAILSTPQDLEGGEGTARRIIDWKRNNLTSSSYYAVFTPWQKVSDPVLGKTVMASPDGLVIAQMSRIDTDYGPWQAAAGTEYGVIRSIGANIEFEENDLDDLYTNGINPIIKDEESNARVIWGNKNGLSVSSPLNRLSVRKLMNMVQKDLGKALRRFIYQPLTAGSRTRIENMCRGYLSGIQSAGGIEAFDVVCDTTNNTSQDIDSLRFNVYIFVRPVQMSEYVRLTSIVTNASVSFSTALSLVQNL